MGMVLRSCALGAVLAAIHLSPLAHGLSPLAHGQAPAEPPLPDSEAFLDEALKRLRSDKSILSRFAYKRHVEERDRDGDGHVTRRRSRTYEVRPLPDDSEGFRLLLERDGRPIPPHEIADQEEEYRRRLTRARAPETDGQRRRRLAREAERRREEEQNVAEVKRIFTAELVRREMVGGVPTIVVSFTPRPDAEPQTRTGRILKNVVGRAWFSEVDYEMVRVESEITDTVRYGWGLVVTIHKGARVVLERRRIGDGTWVPSRYELSGRGRVLVVRGIQRDVTVTLSQFRHDAAAADRPRRSPPLAAGS